MKCSITLHGILEEFAKSLSPRIRSTIIKELLYMALCDGDRDKLYTTLRKFESQKRTKSIIDMLPKTSALVVYDNSSAQTNNANDKNIPSAQSQEEEMNQGIKSKEYREEGSISIGEIYNEFDMTK